MSNEFGPLQYTPMVESTNITLAKLLLRQTYSERLELAGWLAGTIDNDAPPTTIDFASWLEGWANETLENAEEEAS